MIDTQILDVAPPITDDTLQYLRDGLARVEKRRADVVAGLAEAQATAERDLAALDDRAAQMRWVIDQAAAHRVQPTAAEMSMEGPSSCQACGLPMWWGPDDGFVHLMDGERRPAGESCTAAAGGSGAPS